MHSGEVSYLYNDKGEYIAYMQVNGKPNTALPGVIFLSGFMSDMTGSKASDLFTLCQEQGYSYVCFDYYGCGQSSGEFREGTIGRWLDDVLSVIDRLTEGPQILVGSSMGGWLMLLAALARPERVAGLVGIAAAPDFTEELVWNVMTEADRALLVERGYVTFTDCSGDSIITRQLVEEGRSHLLLGGEIAIDCPVRLLQGMRDEEVPYQTALRIAEKVRGADVEVHMVKNADHRMSRPENLGLLRKTVREMVEGGLRS